MVFEAHNGDFSVSTDPARLDSQAIYSFLSQTYWARNRPRAVLETAIHNSLCFGVYKGNEQVGFARAITDRATFGYLADVYILEPYRRRGLGHWLVSTILQHPELKGMRRWLLMTRDQHSLYERCGFVPPVSPEDLMEKVQPYPQPSDVRQLCPP